VLLEVGGPVLTEADPSRRTPSGGDDEAEHVGRDPAGQPTHLGQVAARLEGGDGVLDRGPHVHRHVLSRGH
jgi:hypothetical protein